MFAVVLAIRFYLTIPCCRLCLGDLFEKWSNAMVEIMLCFFHKFLNIMGITLNQCAECSLYVLAGQCGSFQIDQFFL